MTERFDESDFGCRTCVRCERQWCAKELAALKAACDCLLTTRWREIGSAPRRMAGSATRNSTMLSEAVISTVPGEYRPLVRQAG